MELIQLTSFGLNEANVGNVIKSFELEEDILIIQFPFSFP